MSEEAIKPRVFMLLHEKTIVIDVHGMLAVSAHKLVSSHRCPLYVHNVKDQCRVARKANEGTTFVRPSDLGGKPPVQS